MKNLYLLIAVCGLALGALSGCGQDPNRPTTLAQQKSLMDGSNKPTKEQLSEAMSHVHLPGPPPKGGAPSASGK